MTTSAERREADDSVNPLLLSLPFVLLAMLSDTDAPVGLFRHNSQPDTWCFKIGRQAVLEVSCGGTHQWRNASPDIRAAFEPIIAEAATYVRRHAHLASGFRPTAVRAVWAPFCRPPRRPVRQDKIIAMRLSQRRRPSDRPDGG